MTHALIIDDNLAVSRAIQDRLQAFGFDSFDHTWAEHQALEAAAIHSPDLIVVGDTIAEGSPLDVAGELAGANGVPVLVVTAHRFMLQQRMPEGAVVDGPYPLMELDKVLGAITSKSESEPQPG